MKLPNFKAKPEVAAMQMHGFTLLPGVQRGIATCTALAGKHASTQRLHMAPGLAKSGMRPGQAV